MFLQLFNQLTLQYCEQSFEQITSTAFSFSELWTALFFLYLTYTDVVYL